MPPPASSPRAPIWHWLDGLRVAAPRLAAGAPAPDFALEDQDGVVHDLARYRGRWLVLYFYPRDETSGCTREACQFRDNWPALRALGVHVLGISADTRASHARFAASLRLPFPLLVDTGHACARAYGALMILGPLKMIRRDTIIVSPAGTVARIYRDVTADGHSREILADLTALQSDTAG